MEIRDTTIILITAQIATGGSLKSIHVAFDNKLILSTTLWLKTNFNHKPVKRYFLTHCRDKIVSLSYYFLFFIINSPGRAG